MPSWYSHIIACFTRDSRIWSLPKLMGQPLFQLCTFNFYWCNYMFGIKQASISQCCGQLTHSLVPQKSMWHTVTFGAKFTGCINSAAAAAHTACTQSHLATPSSVVREFWCFDKCFKLSGNDKSFPVWKIKSKLPHKKNFRNLKIDR